MAGCGGSQLARLLMAIQPREKSATQHITLALEGQVAAWVYSCDSDVCFRVYDDYGFHVYDDYGFHIYDYE